MNKNLFLFFFFLRGKEDRKHRGREKLLNWSTGNYPNMLHICNCVPNDTVHMSRHRQSEEVHREYGNKQKIDAPNMTVLVKKFQSQVHTVILPANYLEESRSITCVPDNFNPHAYLTVLLKSLELLTCYFSKTPSLSKF